MTRDETRSLLALLNGAYPAANIKRESLEAYALCLQRLPFEDAKRAAAHHISTSRFFPTVAELLQHAASEKVQAPLPDIAYAQASSAADDPPRRGDLHPLVTEAVYAIGGWWPLRRGDDAKVMRGQFVRAYRDILAEHIEEVTTGKALPIGPAGEVPLLAEPEPSTQPRRLNP